MRRSASQIVKNLEVRIARLEKQSSPKAIFRQISKALSRKEPFIEFDTIKNEVHFNSGGDEGIETLTLNGTTVLLAFLSEEYGHIDLMGGGRFANKLAKSLTVKVEWDFEDTDLEDLPYRQALRESGLREKIKLPSRLIREVEGLDEEERDEIISDFLSDEYGFTHYGWEFV